MASDNVALFRDAYGNEWDVWYSADDGRWLANRWADDWTVEGKSVHAVRAALWDTPDTEDCIASRAKKLAERA